MILTMKAKQKAIVIAETIAGKTERQIAAQIGCSQPAVNNVKRSADVRPILDKALSNLIKRGANPAVKTLCRAAALGNTKCAPNNIDLFKLSIQASDKILTHINGGGPQTVINQLININSSPETSKEVQAIQSFINAQIIDV
jgi:hypothetical protein